VAVAVAVVEMVEEAVTAEAVVTVAVLAGETAEAMAAAKEVARRAVVAAALGGRSIEAPPLTHRAKRCDPRAAFPVIVELQAMPLAAGCRQKAV
jgi:hypothetical protein